MDAIAGKDAQGNYWFKSDQSLTDVSDASYFYVHASSSWFTRWKKPKYKLYARYFKKVRVWNSYYSQHENVQRQTDKVIGTYKSEFAASLALEEVMKIKKIKEL